MSASPINFLFVSLEGLSTDLAWQVAKEGHGVRYFIQNKDEAELGDGFIDKTHDWEADVAWADVVVFDDTLGQGPKAAKLRDEGVHVIGGSPYSDKLEDDRAFGQSEFKRMGVRTTSSWDFSSFDEAIGFVQENPSRYVIKPNAEASNTKGFLYVGREEDGRDILQVLEDYRNAWSEKIPSFQLQKFLAGVEVAVGAFFNGRQFVTPININFEHKKLFPGDLGPSTGEMGTSMYWSSPNKLFNETLQKFEYKLAEEGYNGYIDVNCIVNSQGIYPLEWTTRFGYPTIHIQEESLITPTGEFLYGLANGSLKTFKAKKGFQIGVRLVVPPFPFTDAETFRVKSKDSVIHLKGSQDGIHLEDVKNVNGEWVVTGTSGVVLVVCGLGNTMRQAQQQAYNRIKTVHIPHMYYRTDIGDRWHEDSDKLHSWGYLREG